MYSHRNIVSILLIFIKISCTVGNGLALGVNHSHQIPKELLNHKLPTRNVVTAARVSNEWGGEANGEKNHVASGIKLMSIINPNNVRKIILNQYQLRIAADPEFVQKSIVEVIFAVTMQFAAEVSRRGFNRILPEIDFVIAGLLTATAGKYYSMWRVAKTISHHGVKDRNKNQSHLSTWICKVPTNAFQDTLIDGITKPNFLQRVAAFFVPMPSLFQAGFIASFIGYGFTSSLITIRTMIMPTYEAATVSVNILHACFYTGAFMAVISNIRYQVLQGFFEPLIEKLFKNSPATRKLLISSIRLGNGLLGSYLAISGMKRLGLQKLK